jgi:hypothetical protein
MTQPTSAGLRHYTRIPFAAAVLLHLPGKTLTVQLVDIALKGALVESDSKLDVVMQTKCRLELPMSEGGEGLVLTGKLVHQDGVRLGIECLDIDVTSLTRLRRLLELNTGDTERMHRELSHLFSSQ